MVAHCFATSTGSRNASERTFMPNFIRRVRPAIAAIAVIDSRMGFSLMMPVGLPERVDAARFAQVDPAPKIRGVGEREIGEAETDANGHVDLSIALMLVPNRRPEARVHLRAVAILLQ